VLQHALDIEQLHPDFSRSSTTLESIYFNAMFRGDGSNGWAGLHTLKIDDDIDQSTVLRATAALHFAEGNFQLALEKCQEALNYLQSSHDKGGSLAEADWLNAVVSRCKSAMSIQ
jgi:hypothetical protein